MINNTTKIGGSGLLTLLAAGCSVVNTQFTDAIVEDKVKEELKTQKKVVQEVALQDYFNGTAPTEKEIGAVQELVTNYNALVTQAAKGGFTEKEIEGIQTFVTKYAGLTLKDDGAKTAYAEVFAKATGLQQKFDDHNQDSMHLLVLKGNSVYGNKHLTSIVSEANETVWEKTIPGLEKATAYEKFPTDLNVASRRKQAQEDGNLVAVDFTDVSAAGPYNSAELPASGKHMSNLKNAITWAYKKAAGALKLGDTDVKATTVEYAPQK